MTGGRLFRCCLSGPLFAGLGCRDPGALPFFPFRGVGVGKGLFHFGDRGVDIAGREIQIGYAVVIIDIFAADLAGLLRDFQQFGQRLALIAHIIEEIVPCGAGAAAFQGAAGECGMILDGRLRIRLPKADGTVKELHAIDAAHEFGPQRSMSAIGMLAARPRHGQMTEEFQHRFLGRPAEVGVKVLKHLEEDILHDVAAAGGSRGQRWLNVTN